MTWEGVHQLMVQAKGDTAAWNQLHALVRPFLLELAGKTLGPGWPDRSASDLLQTTLLHAWENLETFRGGVDDDSTTAILRAWLARIMRNAHHNDVRYHQAGRRTLRDGCKFLAEPERAEAPARDPTPSQAARTEEQRLRIEAALASLPDELDRKILRGFFFDGQSLTALAANLGVSLDRVRKRYHDSLARLRPKLGTLQ